MSSLASLNRIRSAVRSSFGIGNLDEWICANTYLKGKKFSFENYEFQIPIAKDQSKTSIVIKPAQIGMSELSYRYAIATCCVLENWTTIYTFPSSSDASKNATTRIDPLIQSSPEVRRLVNNNLNNSELKHFGANSFIFFKGTFSETQALSTPANMVIHDEWDKSDTTQGSVYVSRLQNRPDKLRRIFSTPTVDNYGVSMEASTAVRKVHMATCAHCNHTFLPDYYEHVKVPDFDKPLFEITKANLHTTRWREAQLICPSCGRDPDLHHTRMQYVAENGNERHEATAWLVNPFSAHKIMSPSYLVQASTLFAKRSEFVNQSLGLTSEEKNESILAADIDQAQRFLNLQSSETHVMGSDMGLTCYVCIGRIATDGTFLIVHREKIDYTMFEEQSAKLAARFRVVLHVMDAQPLTDLVQRVTKRRAHNWAALFNTTLSAPLFKLDNQEENEKEGKMNLKLVKIGRTLALDSLLTIIKEGRWAIQNSTYDDEYKAQMLTLKRVQKFTKQQELTYVWEKTGQENDHFHFATLYLYIATQMRAMVGGLGSTSVGIPLVTRFKQK
jgi:hypothetical protein